MNLTDKNVVDHFYGQKTDKLGRRKFFSKLWKECLNDTNNEYHQFLLNRFDDSDDIYESLFRLRYGIYVRPVCDCCGGRVEFSGHPHRPYRSTCCETCQRIMQDKNAKKNNLIKYGVDTPMKLKEVKDKIRQTCKKKYGVDWAFQAPEVITKIAKTCEEKYGVSCAAKAKEVKDKIKQSYIAHYGVESPMQCQEVKDKKNKTTKERYGVEYSMQCQEIQLKRFNTCKERYGFKVASMSQDVINTMLQTQRERGTIGNKSKQEDEIFRLLCIFYGEDNVKRQYNKPEYPYDCDFYITPLDLRIEYNGYCTHGYHPYDETNENDQIRLKELEEKNTPFSLNSKHIWIHKDPKKRQCAQNNNLNFIELWPNTWKEIKRLDNDEDKIQVLVNKINDYFKSN